MSAELVVGLFVSFVCLSISCMLYRWYINAASRLIHIKIHLYEMIEKERDNLTDCDWCYNHGYRQAAEEILERNFE